MTWPWIRHIRDSCADAGDPYLSAWILWWDFHQTFHDPLNLFHANILFPARFALAFSEHDYGIALPLFPLFALGLRPLTAQGVATLVGFAFSGYGAFRLGRTLTGSSTAAWISGIGFAFVGYRFEELPHVNYLSAGWMPLLLEATVLFVRARTPGRAVWLGVAFFFNGLSVIHWLILTLVPLALTFVTLAARERVLRERALWTRGWAAVGVAVVALLPFLVPYQRASELYGLVRSRDEAAWFSAHAAQWLNGSKYSKVWSHLRGPEVDGAIFRLFPGFLLVLLPLAALIAASRRARRTGEGDGNASDAIPVGVIWAVTGFFGSLGMHFPFHRVLFDLIPVFHAIRAPSRWAMICDLGLAILAGEGARRLFAALETRSSRLSAGLPFVLCAALLIDLRAAPLDLVRGEADPDEVTRFLASTTMSGGLVELPSGTPSHGNYRAVLRAADHGKPLVTGVSGFGTPALKRIEEDTSRKPIPDDLIDELERIPASYVLVRDSWLDLETRPAYRDWVSRGMASGRLVFVKRFDPHLRNDLFAVTKIEPGARTLARLPWRPVPPSPSSEAREDADLTGAVDEPAEGTLVGGTLSVSGWARIPGDDLTVTLLIDGEERRPGNESRTNRSEVGALVAGLGDCSRAGWVQTFGFEEGDAGEHEIVAVFRSADGRVRHYSGRRFLWRP